MLGVLDDDDEHDDKDIQLSNEPGAKLLKCCCKVNAHQVLDGGATFLGYVTHSCKKVLTTTWHK